MILSFHPCFDADVNVVLGSRLLSADDLDLIGQADAVIMPQARPEEIYEACSRANLRLFPNYDARFRYPADGPDSVISHQEPENEQKGVSLYFIGWILPLHQIDKGSNGEIENNAQAGGQPHPPGIKSTQPVLGDKITHPGVPGAGHHCAE